MVQTGLPKTTINCLQNWIAQRRRWKVGRKHVISAGVQTPPHRKMVAGYLQPGHDDAGDCG
jgi:hypothetical protein